MHPQERGYFTISRSDVEPGARYFYRLNGETDRPDPASRAQPDEVHGPSELLALASFEDTPGWQGLPLEHYIFYELHVGTFTPEGTLDAIVPHLDRLVSLGVTAIELMPIAEFPGSRNWGYDGVYPYAVEQSYGGVNALRRLVRACHNRGLAVVLDVVYNHLGPEGNYLNSFGPYFTPQVRTCWGDALNFDGPHSDEVRWFFLQNALYWIEECGIDALRLDAVHAIQDRSAYPFLEELADIVHARANELGRHVYLVAESDLNDAQLVRPQHRGGYGLDAQWADDFHHCLHTLLTGESSGYYQDFGCLEHLAQAFQLGWVYTGQYSPARRRRFGNSPHDLEGRQFVVCSQNHDQTGNRMQGERLIHLVGPEKARLAAAAVILSPFLPLLFMGEEYGESSPFLYHVSHSDKALLEAVRQGRRQEFVQFLHQGEPPDPVLEETFVRTKLTGHLSVAVTENPLHRYYQELLRLRKENRALRQARKDRTVVECFPTPGVLVVRRLHDEHQALLLLHFGEQTETVPVYLPRGTWRTVLSSADARWGGSDHSGPAVWESAGEEIPVPLAPWSALVLSQDSPSR